MKLLQLIKQRLCPCRKAKTLGDFIELTDDHLIYYISESPKWRLFDRWWVGQCEQCKRKVMFGMGLSLNPYMSLFDTIRDKNKHRDIRIEHEIIKQVFRAKHYRSSNVVVSNLINNTGGVINGGYSWINGKPNKYHHNKEAL